MQRDPRPVQRAAYILAVEDRLAEGLDHERGAGHRQRKLRGDDDRKSGLVQRVRDAAPGDDGVGQVGRIAGGQRHDDGTTGQRRQCGDDVLRRHRLQVAVVGVQRHAEVLLVGEPDRITVRQQVNVGERLIPRGRGPTGFGQGGEGCFGDDRQGVATAVRVRGRHPRRKDPAQRAFVILGRYVAGARRRRPREQHARPGGPARAAVGKGVPHAPGEDDGGLAAREERLAITVDGRLEGQGGDLGGIDDEVDLQGEGALHERRQAIRAEQAGRDPADLPQRGLAPLRIALVAQGAHEVEERLVLERRGELPDRLVGPGGNEIGIALSPDAGRQVVQAQEFETQRPHGLPLSPCTPFVPGPLIANRGPRRQRRRQDRTPGSRTAAAAACRPRRH